MRVAITGAAGLFGHGLVAAFSTRHTVFPLTHEQCDITVAAAVRATLREVRPELVVHPAGIADLDICEADPAKAWRVNFHGTRHVVEASRELGAALVHISTDALFDGEKSSPYTESDQPLPRTVYGRTKFRAEEVVRTLPKHWIFRVSVLFGPGKTNFVEKGLRRIAAGEEYVVASDQLGSATYTLDAGHKIMEVVDTRRYGLYHLSNQGPCTRWELARQAAALAGLDEARVVGIPAEQMGRRAPRLKYAVMEMTALERAGLAPPRHWREALGEYIRTLSLG